MVNPVRGSRVGRSNSACVDPGVVAPSNEAFIIDVSNALTAGIAILDNRGVIAAVNDAWRRFARDDSIERLIGLADRALYAATQTGRNRTIVYSGD